MFVALRKSLGKLLGRKIRSKRWVFFFFMGFLMAGAAFVMVALALLLSAPASIETLKTFHPGALAFTALTLLLISYYWIKKGFQTIYSILQMQEKSIATKLRNFVFSRKKTEEHITSVVALGGGTGLSSLLKGLKEFRLNLTAIVAVTDDGGSSGRLRKEMQILPPGDIRNCLVALSQSESLLSKLFQYRFTEGAHIDGHSFGNLFIAAMTEVLGDFNSAVREAGNILAIKGKVIPVTADNIQLSATFKNGDKIVGETAIATARKQIKKIEIIPNHAQPNQEALSSIDDAEVIILGPGSLYTSVIPNLLFDEVCEHINSSSGKVVYICNVMTQPGETDYFTAYDHVKTLLDTTALKKIDIVIVNSRRAAKPVMQKYESQEQYWVPPTVKRIKNLGIRVICTDLLQESDLLRHNPNLLGSIIYELVGELKTEKASVIHEKIKEE
ncbi:MAG: YvcK family protein [Candidatus Riflebacteria bacterium]|nr:YvcK family protein [Candidatus Riflebacteria bacterium]